MKTYRLFISHSWSYSDAYDRIIKFLDDGGIDYYNHSVPKDNPIHTNGTEWELYDAIESKIVGVSCVLILAGVYASYSRWIDKEIQIAKKHWKKIIAIEPWGSEKTSLLVKNNADMIVKWQSNSILNAIKTLW